MYDFHYNYFKVNYDARLLLNDTDNLAYEIKGAGNIYEKIYFDKDLFDFSNYSKELKFYSERNKKVIGKMQDEMAGKIVSEFIGLK